MLCVAASEEVNREKLLVRIVVSSDGVGAGEPTSDWGVASG